MLNVNSVRLLSTSAQMMFDFASQRSLKNVIKSVFLSSLHLHSFDQQVMSAYRDSNHWIILAATDSIESQKAQFLPLLTPNNVY